MESLIASLKDNRTKYIFISITSKKSQAFKVLPSKLIFNNNGLNVLISNPGIAKEFLSNIDGYCDDIFIDVEKKQDIDLFAIAQETIKHSKVIPYKPNDITLEAADQLILNRFDKNLTGRNILVYGTGNLAFKTALRLIEREANVTIVGRNQNKVNTLVQTLNIIKPKYSNSIVSNLNTLDSTSFDSLISFVSAEKVIKDDYVDFLVPGGIAIDGGIGNFDGEFIASALEKDIFVIRLDVRLGNPFLEASIKSLSEENSFFNEVMGETLVENIPIVAGGIIGKAGSIIVDQIQKPTQIIGIANGYGGLKRDDELSKGDRDNLQYARENII